MTTCSPCQARRILKVAAAVAARKKYGITQLEARQNDDRMYVRTWLIDDKRNGNKWRVSWDSIKRDVKTYIGRPGITYKACGVRGCRLDHVKAPSFEEVIEKQEPHRQSTIVDYELDEATHTAYGIYRIDDDDMAEKIRTGVIKYVSPALWPDKEHTLVTKNTMTEESMIDTTKFKGTHVAFVDEPAYGTKARVEALCRGTAACVRKLKEAGEKSIPMHQLTAVRAAARLLAMTGKKPAA